MQYLYHLGIFTFTMKLEGYCIALSKPKRNTIPASYCDNILNHDTNEDYYQVGHIDGKR
jgi:hypothetical protein